MTAVRLHRCPSAIELADALLRRARDLARRDPGSVLWLAPHPRAVADLRRRLAPVCGVRICTFGDLSNLVIEEAGVLSAAGRRLVAEEIAADLAARGELAHFRRVGDTAGFLGRYTAFVAEMQRLGVGPAAFARAAYRKNSPVGASGSRQKRSAISEKDRDCARLYARYQRELRRLRLHDPDARESLAAASLREELPVPLEGLRHVVAAGFAELSPARQALLAALARHAEEVHVGLCDEPGEERAELFDRPRRLALLFPGAAEESHAADHARRPAGLAHLAHQLFRPLRRVERSADAAGLAFVEAPGMLGEVRLVARRVKALLLDGARPGSVLVSARDIAPYDDLLRDVFAEYEVPLDLEGGEPLTRLAGVSLLLEALRLPEDDHPFAGVTALLRHTFFRPDWAEVSEPELPQKAEVLLRLLAEPRGRAAYLAAVARWAEGEQPGLEDEAAEARRRRRTHDLAKLCRPFLERFFRLWDGAPERADFGDHIAWLRAFLDETGVGRACDADERHRAGLEVLFAELAAWQMRRGTAPLDGRTFRRRLAALSGGATLPRPAVDGVMAVSAPVARHLGADHVFLLGLGERGFPRPAAEPSLLDDADRAALAGAGDHLADEMLLFYQVVSAARLSLTLCYPAVDERGQEMLPGSFLAAVRDCFAEGAVPTQRRRMLIEGHDSDAPLSQAEYRVRVAAAWPAGADRLPEGARAGLSAAAKLVEERFARREFGPYDGRFRDPLLIEWAAKQFGPRHVFSPTALEDYVACPFRFLLRHLLRLEPLEVPREQIEVTRRGMAWHRALARLHRRLKEQDVHAPTAAVEDEVLHEIRTAVEEDVERAPGPAAKELWRLEGRRLLRTAGRYPAQWERFLEPWAKRGVAPRPYLFEADFGLPAPEGQAPLPPLVLRAGGVEVRVSGRIDRVDLAELDDGLGFWIIDYKTGRSSHYTGTDLAEFRKLQLTLYALAVESVLLPGARPLGLAYWLVSEAGPKLALPGRSAAAWLDDPEKWPAIREALAAWVAALVGKIREGAFPLAPRSEHCTQTCPYAQVCRIGQSRAVGKTFELPLPGDSLLPSPRYSGERGRG